MTSKEANLSEKEIVDAIRFAEDEHDWEEVERLYKILFNLHDKNGTDNHAA